MASPTTVVVDGSSATGPVPGGGGGGAEAPVPQVPFLRRFPNTAFSIAIALGAHASLWQNVGANLCRECGSRGFFDFLAYFFWFAALVVFLICGAAYSVKIVRHKDIVAAEWRDPVRSNFCMMPGIVVILLTLSVPVDLFGGGDVRPFYQTGFFLGLFYQVVLIQVFYQRWMTAQGQQLSASSTPFLLTTINWFLLSLLGVTAQVRDLIGLDLPPMLFGVGAFFAAVIYFNIFQRMHEGTAIGRGHPAMFLVLAPLSVASSAVSAMDGGNFGAPSRGLFGLAVVLFLFLLGSGPQLMAKPPFMGIYWAYVFPLAALANAAIAYAKTEGTQSAKIVAWFFTVVAGLGILIVMSRMSFHQYEVCRGRAMWKDPLQAKFDAGKTKAEAVGEEPAEESLGSVVDEAPSRKLCGTQGAEGDSEGRGPKIHASGWLAAGPDMVASHSLEDVNGEGATTVIVHRAKV